MQPLLLNLNKNSELLQNLENISNCKTKESIITSIVKTLTDNKILQEEIFKDLHNLNE